MANTIQLDDMSIEEKIQTMESIWEDLCKRADSTFSPPWHERILEQREEDAKSGKEKFVDWDLAKKNIRNEIS